MSDPRYTPVDPTTRPADPRTGGLPGMPATGVPMTPMAGPLVPPGGTPAPRRGRQAVAVMTSVLASVWIGFWALGAVAFAVSDMYLALAGALVSMAPGVWWLSHRSTVKGFARADMRPPWAPGVFTGIGLAVVTAFVGFLLMVAGAGIEEQVETTKSPAGVEAPAKNNDAKSEKSDKKDTGDTDGKVEKAEKAEKKDEGGKAEKSDKD
ncbi:hypothetical protein C1Y63_06315 [Corynebacterium sp. 13CS0277]|uniref:hypothetical protein n=1 Tax=Corynebacterium sp. 13CS0277 TaxID=2071994 RepID=UPI000D03C278|nr:hypothetical protein [Corynebacterium sp. 13CS0277]PRQ11455.1 hypothetical protein C1Y63_06315 [Corynebacterium sp. 13CS0277]